MWLWRNKAIFSCSLYLPTTPFAFIYSCKGIAHIKPFTRSNRLQLISTNCSHCTARSFALGRSAIRMTPGSRSFPLVYFIYRSAWNLPQKYIKVLKLLQSCWRHPLICLFLMWHIYACVSSNNRVRVSAIKCMLFYYRHISIFVFFKVSLCSLLLPTWVHCVACGS